MNPHWLSILQHTLGLDQYGQPPQACYGGMHVFHATQAGFDAVKQHSPRPPRLTLGQRRWRHFRDVREACPDLTFKAYLNAPWRAESEARAGI